MLRNPKVWEDAETFNPERWLTPEAVNLPNPTSAVFGFGTRLCPGRYLAEIASYCIVSSILSVYDIVPVPGETVPTSPAYVDSAFR